MNTFIIKSDLTCKGGKYLGLTNSPEYKSVYAFRSHQSLKEVNPEFTEFEVLNEEQLRQEFDFKKYNICPLCGGVGGYYEIPLPEGKVTFDDAKVTFDDAGYVIFGENIGVYCTCNEVVKVDDKYENGYYAGTYIGYLENRLSFEKRDHKHDVDELTLQLGTLQLYVKSKSTCKTCEGDQQKMYTHQRCEECGLPGAKQFIMGG